MYTNYFGLKEKPFSIAPDPRYLYMSESHREALAHLLYGISSDGCFILLTGDVGTGKTTLCRCLLAQLPDKTDVALIADPRLTVLELLVTLCDELKIPMDGGDTSANFYVERLTEYLQDSHASGRNVALFIDEAQNLSFSLLEQLCLLADIESDQQKLLKIVVLGQTELRQILNQEGSVQISQRITSRYHLLPLDRENTFSYVQHRLAVAGEQGKVFSNDALAQVFIFSKGIPRLINVLCDRCLLDTYKSKKYLVTDAIVEKAARDVLRDSTEKRVLSTRKQIWAKLILAVLIFLLGAGGVSYYLSNQASVDPLHAQQSVANAIDAVAEEPMVKPVAAMPQVEERAAAKSRVRIAPLRIND